LSGLLFISFRKHKAVELWNRGKQTIRRKLQELNDKSPIKLPSNIPRLSRSTSTTSSLSSSSSSNDPDLEDDGEVLPYSSINDNNDVQRFKSLERRSRSMFENLKNNLFQIVGSLGFAGENTTTTTTRTSSEGGLKRLLMGKRDVDRGIGRIRLLDGETSHNLFELGTEEEEGEQDATILSNPTTTTR